MKALTLLTVCCLVLCSTLLTRATTGEIASPTPGPHGVTASTALAFDCGGEPCDAVQRGFLAFFDRKPDGLGGNGRACADCHMPTDQFQLSPASVEARFRLLQLRRRWNPEADDPLFRPVDADDFRTNGDAASDFSNLRQNGLVRITLPLPPTIRLIDPATNAVSNETTVDVWRMVPTVNDVALTGPDASLPVWPRDPNPMGGYQLDARLTTLQEQASGALVNHAQIQDLPAQQLLDDLSSFQRVLFTNHRVRALSDAVRAGTTPLPDPDPRLNQLEQQGKVVFDRACRHCHGGPGVVDSCCADQSVHHHFESVPASRGHGDATPLRVRRMRASSLAQCADVRGRAVFADAGPDGAPSSWDQGATHELRSGACTPDWLRRRTGPPRRLGQVRYARAARDPRHGPLFPQQQCRDARRCVRSLRAVLQASRGDCGAGRGLARCLD